MKVTINDYRGNLADLAYFYKNSKENSKEITQDIILEFDDERKPEKVYLVDKYNKDGSVKEALVIDIEGLSIGGKEYNLYNIKKGGQKVLPVEGINTLDEAFRVVMYREMVLSLSSGDNIKANVWRTPEAGGLSKGKSLDTLGSLPDVIEVIRAELSEGKETNPYKKYDPNQKDGIERTQINKDMLEGLKLDLSSPKSLDGQEEYAGVPYNPEAMAGKSGGQGKA
jgi:hypothetical protein